MSLRDAARLESRQGGIALSFQHKGEITGLLDVMESSRLVLLAGVPTGLQRQADSGSTLMGSVVDSTGAVLPQLALALSIGGPHDLRSAKSDDTGEFRFADLGRWKLQRRFLD